MNRLKIRFLWTIWGRCMIRKIDKRACRKFAAPGLTFNLNDGVLHAESVQYIIRTAVRNISGQRILILYIYPRENILAGHLYAPLGHVPRQR